MLRILDAFASMLWPVAATWLLAINGALLVVSVSAGAVLARLFRHRPVTPPPPPLQWQEVVWALVCVLLNSGVTVAGWLLWQAGFIRVRRDTGWCVAVDVVVLLVLMDFLMYLFHRLAHTSWLFPLFHHMHHRYDRPRPLDLFVVHPLEVVGFGLLWLAVLCLYSASWLGILVYLTLNLAFGTLGHAGVEPYPAACLRWPLLLQHFGSSTFHARHHQDIAVNFGFYTDVWDRLFRTLGRRRGAESTTAPGVPICPTTER